MKKVEPFSCFHHSFLIYGLRWSEIVFFLEMFADLSKQYKAVIAFYVYTSESSRFALSENGIAMA